MRGETLPRGRALGAGELAALMGACSKDPGPAGARDAALLALLYGGGLRRSEAVALDLDDYEAESGQLTIRAGKGHKDRTAWVTNGSSLALADWLAVRGDEPGPLFTAIGKGGRVSQGRLSGQAVHVMLRKRATTGRGGAPQPARPEAVLRQPPARRRRRHHDRGQDGRPCQRHHDREV